MGSSANNRPVEPTRMLFRITDGQVVRKDGRRPATTEEIELWELLNSFDTAEKNYFGYYLFYRMESISVKDLSPRWINLVLKDFNRLEPVKLFHILKREFPDQFKAGTFKEGKELICAKQSDRTSGDHAVDVDRGRRVAAAAS